MLQFSKCLASKGLKATIAVTPFIYNSMKLPPSIGPVQIVTMSDGYDEAGFAQADSIETYLERMKEYGSKSLAEVIMNHQGSPDPIDCIIYDSFLQWALDVAKDFGLMAASFFTQSCAVDYIFYMAFHGILKLPIASTPVSLQGLPPLDLQDMPSFIYDLAMIVTYFISDSESYPAYIKTVLNQFSNVEKVDCVLVNTFYELEKEVVDAMAKLFPTLTIGPTIPSMYLDKCIEGDKDYGVNLFTLDGTSCTQWLNNKPARSVIYVSFGSLVNLCQTQTEEIAWALKEANFSFIWVIRCSEVEKLPKEFQCSTEKGLIVNWCPQLEVLSNEAVGCFFTHCGWNSTVEALSLGVPMVAMPQWTDQPTDAKLVEDVWMTGVRVKVDADGIVRRGEIESCIGQVMEGAKGRELRKNAKKWKDVAIEAMSENGSSNKNIESFISKLTKKC